MSKTRKLWLAKLERKADDTAPEQTRCRYACEHNRLLCNSCAGKAHCRCCPESIYIDEARQHTARCKTPGEPSVSPTWPMCRNSSSLSQRLSSLSRMAVTLMRHIQLEVVLKTAMLHQAPYRKAEIPEWGHGQPRTLII